MLDAIRVPSRWNPSKVKESYRATMELFCPSTNTFITPNLELGFSLIEMCDVFGLPILGEFYEEFIPFNSILERETKEFRVVFQQVFALEETSLDKHHKFKAGTWIKNMLSGEPTNKVKLLEDPSAFKKRVMTVDSSSLRPRQKLCKYITSFVDCPEFLPYLEGICSENMLKRRLVAAYLVFW